MDVETGTVSKIGNGWGPSWSPSGDWIAYISYTAHIDDKHGWRRFTGANGVSLMHPDGTDSVFIHKFAWAMNIRPIWSPDSKMLLLTSFPDDLTGKFDIFVLDLATRKLTKEFRHTPLIFGWARVNWDLATAWRVPGLRPAMLTFVDQLPDPSTICLLCLQERNWLWNSQWDIMLATDTMLPGAPQSRIPRSVDKHRSACRCREGLRGPGRAQSYLAFSPGDLGVSSSFCASPTPASYHTTHR